MADDINLCDDKIEDHSEIASKENNKDNKEESENSANILVCKRNMKSVTILSRQEKMEFFYTMKWISQFVLFVKNRSGKTL